MIVVVFIKIGIVEDTINENITFGLEVVQSVRNIKGVINIKWIAGVI